MGGKNNPFSSLLKKDRNHFKKSVKMTFKKDGEKKQPFQQPV